MDLEQMKMQQPFMEQFANADPKMQMLAQLLANQQNSNEKSGSGTTAKLRHKVKGLIIKIKRLEVQKKRLLKYIDYFLDVNVAFSSAVGACECWGEDGECEKCKGEGSPGYFSSDPQAFDTYIKPCLENKKVQKSA